MTFAFAYIFPPIAIACGVAVLLALIPFVREIQRDIRKPSK